MPMGDDFAPEEGTLSDEELGAICADVYMDAFNALGSFYVGADVELPEKRAQRRGVQIAKVLRKAGWDDNEIIAYVGLAAGVAGDFAILQRAKALQDAKKAAEAPQPPAGATNAPPSEGAPA